MNSSKPVRVDYYNERTNLIVRLTSLIAPIVAITYGFLVRFDILQIAHTPTNPAIGNLDLYIISFLLLSLGIWQLLAPFRTKISIITQLFMYQVLLGAFLIFVAGLTPPFVAFWALLSMEAWVYLQRRGVIVSMLLFATTATISSLIYQPPSAQSIFGGLLAFILVYVITKVQVRTNLDNAEKKAKVSGSKSREILQRDQFLTIVNNLVDAVVSISLDGIVRIYNPATLNILDTNMDVGGKKIDDVFTITDQQHNPISVMQECKKAKSMTRRDDLIYKLSDGEELRLEMTFSPIRSNFSRSSETHDGYIVIAKNITKAKSLEEERDEFVSVISHELRTPITIAEGTISNVELMTQHPDTTESMLKDNIDLAHNQIIFLADMVNDLSALSRAAGADKEAPEDIDVKELANKLVDKYTEEAKVKKLKLGLEIQPNLGKIRTNRLYIEELLQNFITNAIKYTTKGSVNIVASKKSGTVTFAVSDTGIGISKADQVKIFEKFYRSEDSRTREKSGTGLGLYVASKLAAKIGTRLQLTSRINHGSTFSFDMPEVKNV
ncbi:MAG: ATP-binding protein [Candidatus Saccharibacteria bacterium]